MSIICRTKGTEAVAFGQRECIYQAGLFMVITKVYQVNSGQFFSLCCHGKTTHGSPRKSTGWRFPVALISPGQALANGAQGLRAKWHQTGFHETAQNFPTNDVTPVLPWSFLPAHPWVSARPWCLHLVVPLLSALCAFTPFSFAKKTKNKTNNHLKKKKKEEWKGSGGHLWMMNSTRQSNAWALRKTGISQKQV